MAARTFRATSRALAPGSWKTATPAAGLPLDVAPLVVGLAASSTRATSLTRVSRAAGRVLASAGLDDDVAELLRRRSAGRGW